MDFVGIVLLAQSSFYEQADRKKYNGTAEDLCGGLRVHYRDRVGDCGKIVDLPYLSDRRVRRGGEAGRHGNAALHP